MKGVDFALGNYVKAFKDKPLAYLRLPGQIRGFYWLVWMEANRSGLIPVADATRDELGEALGVILQVDPAWAQDCITKLLDKGFVTFSAGAGGNAIVVTDYVAAQTTATLDKVRAKEYRQRQHENAVASSASRSSSRDESSQRVTNKDQIRDRSKIEINKISPTGECEGGQAPKTDPSPSLRSSKLEQVVGKGPASWGMEGSPDQSQEAKGQIQTPTPRPAAPSPLARQAPLVVVVDPKPVREEIPTAKGRSRAKGGKRAADDEGDPLPEDWTVKDHHYAYGREKLGAHKKHVDYWADDMRDQAMSRGWRAHDWDAKFRTFMRKAMEFSKGVLPNVPDPLPPAEVNRPVPPPPPRHPLVEEGAQRARERLEGPNPPNLMELFKEACNPNKYLTNSEPA